MSDTLTPVSIYKGRLCRLLSMATGVVMILTLCDQANAQTSPVETIGNFPADNIGQPVSSKPLNLHSALAAAYDYNPRIRAARKEYDISQTDIRLSKTLRRPTIDATASYGYLHQDNSFTSAEDSSLSGDTSDISVNFRQPLFRGFQTRNRISGSKSTAYAVKMQQMRMEQTVLLEVVTAYMDMQRDKKLLALNLDNLEVLQSQLTANEKRYSYQDASLTDVARSKSAVASAKARIADSQASLTTSRSTLSRLTGLPSSDVVAISTVPSLPRSISDFLNESLRHNPEILGAQYSLQAAEFYIKEAKGQRLPTVDFNSSVRRGERPENFGLFSDSRVTTAATATVSLRVPIYQAGQEFGNIKRAEQIKHLREIELSQTIANTRDSVRIIWQQIQALESALEAHEEAVNAAKIAAEGTRKLYQSGLISAIDLIDTELALLAANVNSEITRRDYYVTIYNGLSIQGAIKVSEEAWNP